MRICGIDPGINGGLAVVHIDESGALLVDAIDIPTVGIKAKERVNVAAVVAFIIKHKPTRAFIERAGSMPKQGIASTFKHARAVGAIEAAIVCCDVPMTIVMMIVEPAIWKRALGLRGGEKEEARQRALQLFPHAYTLLALKRDHGRGEAALIALAGFKVSAAYAAGSTSETSPT
jgi:crossover junction endodeoxyribonuclease RuvC